MTEPILFFSPQAANSAIEPAASFARVLASNWYILGKEVATFERDFAAYCGVNHGICARPIDREPEDTPGNVLLVGALRHFRRRTPAIRV